MLLRFRFLLTYSAAIVLAMMLAPHSAKAQGDLTAQVSQIYGIPLVQGHLLVPDNPAFAARLVPGTQPQNGRRMSPLEKAWMTFVKINEYRSGAKTYNESLELIPLVLDQNGVNYVVQLIGARPPQPISDANQLKQYLQYQADEFHRQKFQSFMAQQFGADAPVRGKLKVLNIKRVAFGAVDLNLRLLDIQNITGSRNGRGPLGVAEFTEITMPDHELNPEIEVRAPDIEGFVRSLEASQGNRSYGNRRERAAILLVAGELAVNGASAEWRPQALTAYRTLDLTQPIAEITFADIYTDLSAARQAQMAALQAQAARTQAAVQSTTQQQPQQVTQPAAVPGASNQLAAVTAEFAERKFDILGVAPGITEAESRALLDEKFDLSPTGPSKRPSVSGALSPCDVAHNNLETEVGRFAEGLKERNRQAARSDANVQIALSDIQLQTVANHRAALISAMQPECRNPVASSYVAERLHDAGVRDQITVYVAPNAEGTNTVVALTRTLNWQGVTIDVLGQLEAKLGARFTRLNDATRFWSDDPARTVAFAANPVAAQACFGAGRWPIINGAFDRRILGSSCGTILGATQKANSAEIYMADTLRLNKTPTAQTVGSKPAEPAKVKIDF